MNESKERLSEYSSTLDKAKSAYEANKQGADLAFDYLFHLHNI